MDIYVSGVLGNDANPGTMAQPVATLAKAAELIPDVVEEPVVVHLRNEEYVCPVDDGVWLKSRLIQAPGRIEVAADESWDSTVYTVHESGTAMGGTSATTVVHSDMIASEHRGRSIRMVSGGAAGQCRRINANDEGEILPNAAFNPAPAPGDDFEIISPNAIVKCPTPPAGITRYVLVDSMAGGAGTSSAISGAVASAWHSAPTGVRFRGVRLTSVAASFVIGNCQLALLGVDCDKQIRKVGGQVWSGQAAGEPMLEGWGARFATVTGITLANAAQLCGYVHCDIGFPAIEAGCTMSLLGGFAARSLQSIVGMLSIDAPPATPFLLTASAGSALELAVPNAAVQMKNTVVTGGVIVTGGMLYMFGSVSGAGITGQSMIVRGTGRVVCNGAPQFGAAAADDWTVAGAEPFNKAALGTVGSAVVGTDGSVATRAL
jgi:hypothetical protein